MGASFRTEDGRTNVLDKLAQWSEQARGGSHMTAFVSHSFDNKAEFENIADALAVAGVPYWNPSAVKAGESLRDQLRRAVNECSVCIFVATHKSVNSGWCGAELGAFWGARRPILVYLADSSLDDKELPPVVHGDVWDGRISRIVNRAKELVDQSSTSAVEADQELRVGNMTEEQLQTLVAGAVALVVAGGKADKSPTTAEEVGTAAGGAAKRVLRGIEATEHLGRRPTDAWRRQLLWVDDQPGNNVGERRSFESIGLEIVLALSTEEALTILAKRRFAAIISDMGRREGSTEGYVLLEAVRETDNVTPFFIYASSNAPEHKREGARRGAQGVTNRPAELMDLVVDALP
jgi:CheY-like chemotaxis protein